jgi:hypothetical protein
LDAEDEAEAVAEEMADEVEEIEGIVGIIAAVVVVLVDLDVADGDARLLENGDDAANAMECADLHAEAAGEEKAGEVECAPLDSGIDHEGVYDNDRAIRAK